MKSIFTKLSIAVFSLSISNMALAQSSSLPTGGQWQEDRNVRTEWVDFKGFHSLETVNFILCFVKDFWAPSKVNQGPYKAQVNQSKCEGNTETTAGVRLLNVIADLSTTSDGNTEAKLWIPDDKWEDLAELVNAYVKIVATESPSVSNPNGVFEVTWNDIGKTTQRMYFKGRMTASAAGISVHTDENTSSTNARVDKLIMTGNVNSGSGAIYTQDRLTTKYEQIGFNNNANCIKELNQSPTCYSRSRAAGVRSAWRYGVYDAQGRRFDLPNPSFNLRNEDNQWGSANRWGVWSESAWRSGSTVRQVSGVETDRTFTYISIPGRLSQQTSGYHKIVNPSATAITLVCNWGCVTATTIQNWQDGLIDDPKTINSLTTYEYENGKLYLASDSNKTALITSYKLGFGMSLRSNNTSFYYESGPRNWQSFNGLKKADGEFVSFSDPLNFTLPSSGDQLSFEGHGTINGIPSKVFKRIDNTRVDNIPNFYDLYCQNNQCKWVHNYLINDEPVTINGQSYYIQWLQSDIMPAILTGLPPSDIVYGNIDDLPSGELPTNIRSLIGEIPNLPINTPVSVIEGTLVTQ